MSEDRELPEGEGELICGCEKLSLPLSPEGLLPRLKDGWLGLRRDEGEENDGEYEGRPERGDRNGDAWPNMSDAKFGSTLSIGSCPGSQTIGAVAQAVEATTATVVVRTGASHVRVCAVTLAIICDGRVPWPPPKAHGLWYRLWSIRSETVVRFVTRYSLQFGHATLTQDAWKKECE